MPIPPGARQVPGNPNRVQLADGSIVTRSMARSMGARLEGFSSEDQRRKMPERRESDAKYFRSWARSNQGKAAIAQAKTQAAAQGRKYRPEELRTELIAARNDRPHPKSGKAGGAQWRAFRDKYDLAGFPDFVKY